MITVKSFGDWVEVLEGTKVVYADHSICPYDLYLLLKKLDLEVEYEEVIDP